MQHRNDGPGFAITFGTVLTLVVGGLVWLMLNGGGNTPETPAASQPHQVILAPGGPQVTGHPEQGKSNDSADIIGRFSEFLETHKPKVVMLKYQDPVDGKDMQIPSVDQHNLVGGESTDMMWIALEPDPTNPRRPMAGKQEWQLKLGTSPGSKATYMEVDLLNAKSGRAPHSSERMQHWDLAQQCPPLASVPPEQWTDDERNYVHYLTIRQMGFDDTEAGFAALAAAYASNFALWKGEQRTVPGAAYYALAAAHFEQSLAAHLTPDPRSTCVTWMICGEMHRLLGQTGDAQRCFTQGAKLRQALQKPEAQTLDFYLDLLKHGDTALQRLPYTNVPDPPIGWFIENLFPAIDADLQVERAKWGALQGVDDITSAINATIAEKRNSP